MTLRMVRTMLFSVAIFSLAVSAAAYGQVGLFITVAPPPLPVYEQPLCPDDGYLWTPGYWAFDSDIEDYYWVPGTWVQSPEVGYLWTPAYWGWGGDRYVFYDGYWGPMVGFYGGIDYGFGYFGNGFEGGRWDNGRFFYNRAVSNINVTVIHNVYENRVEERSENRVSYNGGQGGLNARPTPQQESAARERHVPPVSAQMQHRQEARSNPQQRASVNRGKPEVAATPRPGGYKEQGAVQARAAGGNYTPAPNRGGGQSHENSGGGRSENSTRPDNNARPASGNNGGGGSYNHVREMPPYERQSSSDSSDKKYQKEQDKMYKDQQKERQKVAQQQEKEDQRMSKQNNEQSKQQMEQRHQQQTQEMQSKHQQQQQQMQQRSAPRTEPKSAPREQTEPNRRPPQ